MKLSLSQNTHQLAQRFAAEQPNPDKGKIVYLNTLAVHAVARYLKLQGIEVDLDQGKWRNPISRILEDTTDLVIPKLGALECRPVLLNDLDINLPETNLEDEVLGYVAVCFDEDLKAELLGFLPTYLAKNRLKVPLKDLKPLETIFEYLTPVMKLWQPIENHNASGWKALDALVQDLSEQMRSLLMQPEVAFRSRGDASNAEDTSPEVADSNRIIRVKPIEVGMSLILKLDRIPLKEEQVQIVIKVYPLEAQVSIPPDLQLIVSSGETTLAPATRSEGNYVEKRLKGCLGERFQLQIVLGDREYTEMFEI